jgi:hypothetical protein
LGLVIGDCKQYLSADSALNISDAGANRCVDVERRSRRAITHHKSSIINEEWSRIW